MPAATQFLRLPALDLAVNSSTRVMPLPVGAHSLVHQALLSSKHEWLHSTC